MNRGSIEIPFPVGAKVWWCGPVRDEKIVRCPDCVGLLRANVILGCGDVVQVPCPTCTMGYNPPTGTITVAACGAAPREVVLDDVEVRGEDIRYFLAAGGGGHYVLDPADLFEDRAACEARCMVKAAEWQAAEDARALACLKQKRRDMANPVAYWRREVRDLEQKLAAARRKAGM